MTKDDFTPGPYIYVHAFAHVYIHANMHPHVWKWKRETTAWLTNWLSRWGGSCHSATACCTRQAGEPATFIVMKLWLGEAGTRNSISRSVLFIEKHSDMWLPVSNQVMAHASHPLGFVFLISFKNVLGRKTMFGGRWPWVLYSYLRSWKDPSSNTRHFF